MRLAPYPYNLMVRNARPGLRCFAESHLSQNTLLASSPTLTLKTYTTCTALALPKLLVHTGIGTTIKNFAAYNGAEAQKEAPSDTARTLKSVAGVVGIGLCVGVFFYIFSIASAAVDELDSDDDMSDGEDDDDDELSEEELPFLRRSSPEQQARQVEMRQVPLRPLSQADMVTSLAERRAKRNSVRFAQNPMVSAMGADRPYSPFEGKTADWQAQEPPHDTSLVDSIDHFERVAASTELPRSR